MWATHVRFRFMANTCFEPRLLFKKFRICGVPSPLVHALCRDVKIVPQNEDDLVSSGLQTSYLISPRLVFFVLRSGTR